MFWLASLAYGFPLLTLALDVLCAVHCIRRGNPAWLLVILFFPVVGALVYLIVEYVPDVRARGSVGDAAQKVKNRINPAAEIRRLEDQVAVSSSLVNRMALARGYLRVGRADDAIALYRQSLSGIYEDDPQVLWELTGAYYTAGRLDEARATFERLRAAASLLSSEQLTLSAVIHEDAGDLEAAAREYAAILTRPVIGEQARCRYALVLKRLARTSEANALFEEIVRHARLSPAHYRRAERQWIEIAKKELASSEAAAR